MRKLSFAVVLLTTGCVVYQPVPTYSPPPRVVVEPAAPVYEPPPPPPPVVSVYVEAPIDQPAPIACPWAPPPMLVEEPPPPPFYEAVWIGGFWVWQGAWVWDHGRWAEPPRRDYHWVHPYYEHRNGVVLFITGHWASVNAVFVVPRRDRDYEVERPLPGVVLGPRPIGPDGVFIPPPPGSRAGIIIPAPIGTAPAVVTSAPPVVNVGMRVTNNVNNTTVINNVTNVTNVTIIAPASATSTGQAVNTTVPAQAHLAAALPPAVRVAAPEPASRQSIPAFVRGRTPIALPPPQPVHAEIQASPRPMTPAPASPGAPARPMTPAPAPFEARPSAPPPAAVAAPPAAPAALPRPETATAAPLGTPNENRKAADSKGSSERKPTAQPNAPAAKAPAPVGAPKAAQNAQAPTPAHKDKAVSPTKGDEKGKAAEKQKPNENHKDSDKEHADH
jgi:hypothetical protein